MAGDCGSSHQENYWLFNKILKRCTQKKAVFQPFNRQIIQFDFLPP